MTEISSGESGDPMILNRGGGLWLFNRTSDSQNFRSVAFDGSQKAALGVQTKFSGGAYGDPHDMIMLSQEQMLVANYTGGTINMVSVSTGEVISQVQADWDLPDGSQLHPEALIEAQQKDGDRLILIVHQAFTFSGGQSKVNGSQQVFVLKLNADLSLEVVDIEPDTPKVQGIKLHGSLPSPSGTDFNGNPLLISMCYKSLIQSKEACSAAVEVIDVETLTAELVWNLDGEGLFMNGPVYGSSDSKVMANVEIDQAGKFTKNVIELDLKLKQWKGIHEFPSASSGAWGGFYDPATGTAYIGDTSTDGKSGRLTVVKGAEATTEIATPFAPYSGAFATLE